MKIDGTELAIYDLDNVITWQYDKSPTLIALFRAMESVLDSTSTSFLNNFKNFVVDIRNIGANEEIGASPALSIWGTITGLPRPMVSIGGNVVPISDDLYKRILTARLHQMYRPGTITAIEEFMSEVFGNSVHVIDNNDMTIGIIQIGELTEEETALISSPQDIEKFLELPIGVGLISARKPTGQFGLNISESEGQNMENFAQEQSNDWGGSLS